MRAAVARRELRERRQLVDELALLVRHFRLVEVREERVTVLRRHLHRLELMPHRSVLDDLHAGMWRDPNHDCGRQAQSSSGKGRRIGQLVVELRRQRRILERKSDRRRLHHLEVLVRSRAAIARRSGRRQNSRRAEEIGWRRISSDLDDPNSMCDHLYPELRPSCQRVGQRFAVGEHAPGAARDRYRPLPDDRHRRTQCVLLLLDVAGIVKQQPHEACVLAGEDDGRIHGGVGGGTRRGAGISHGGMLRRPRPDTQQTPGGTHRSRLSRHPVPVTRPDT